MNLEKHLPPGQGTIANLLYSQAQRGPNLSDTRGVCVRDRRSVFRKGRLEAFRAKSFTAQQCQQLRNIPGAAARRTRGSDIFCREHLWTNAATHARSARSNGDAGSYVVHPLCGLTAAVGPGRSLRQVTSMVFETCVLAEPEMLGKQKEICTQSTTAETFVA